MRVTVKPLSANRAWKGKRFKTSVYKAYERQLLLLLPATMDIPDGDLHIDLVFGMSSSGSDLDNPVKPFVDVLQKKYGFNDNRIMSATLSKSKTKKARSG